MTRDRAAPPKPEAGARSAGLAPGPWLVMGCLALSALAGWSTRRLANDDAFITYRYATNLARGDGMVFNPGERVMGTTSPLYTLLMALLARLQIPLPPASNGIGCAAVLCQALAARRLVARFGGGGTAPDIVALFIAGGGIGSYWHVGMETNVVAALLLWGGERLVAGQVIGAAVVVSLACLTRPDAILLLALASLQAVVAFRTRLRSLLAPAAIVIVLGGVWVLFSAWYFGSMIPGSLEAKLLSVSRFEYLGLATVRTATAGLGWLRESSPISLGFPSEVWAEDYVFATLIYGLWLVGLVGPVGVGCRRLSDRLVFFYPVVFVGSYSLLAPPPEQGWHLYPAQLFLFLAAVVGLRSLPWPKRRCLWRQARFGSIAGGLVLVAGAIYLIRFESYHQRDKWFGRRAQTLFEVSRIIADNVPPERTVCALEIGILGYSIPNPIIDRAGIITPGLYHHRRDRRTSLAATLARHSPDVVVIRDHDLARIGGEYRLVGRASDHGYGSFLVLAQRRE